MNIVVAACKNRGIGLNNSLPWKLKNELKFFKYLTIGDGNNAVVMGKNTWNSIKKPLVGRENYVLTSSMDETDHVKILRKKDHIFELPYRFIYDDIWIIGGERLYRELIDYPIVKSIFYTDIDLDIECDTFFPEIPDNFKKVFESGTYNENGISYKHIVFDNQKLASQHNSVPKIKNCINKMIRDEYHRIMKVVNNNNYYHLKQVNE